MRIFKKIFSKLYPAKMKYCWTTQGDWLRKMLGAAVICHCLFFIISLAIVGFWTMFINFILACWAYSVYLTMAEWSNLLYIIFLMAATLWGLFYGI